MAQACEALGLPIVSGNVSLYNDTDGRSIHPHTGRRLRRPRSGRSPHPGAWIPGDVILLALDRDARARRSRAPGALRHRLRDAADARPARRGGARSIRRRRRAPLHARTRRLRRRPRSRARRGCAALRCRRPARSSRRPAHALRGRLRPGGPRRSARSGRDRPARLRGRCPANRRGRWRRDPGRLAARPPSRLGA